MVDDDPVARVLARCAALPSAAVVAVFARYGHPLDDEACALDPMVQLADGAAQVGRLQHRAPVDVIANDYFVLRRAGETPAAIPGALFAAAIAALARDR